MSTQREITKTELKAHNKPDDLWCAISGKVYDLTKFKAEHPGGDDVLIDSAGKDATRDFIEVGHSKEAEDMMKQYCIGVLAKDDQPCGSKCIFLSAGAVLAGILTAIIIKRIISGSK